MSASQILIDQRIKEYKAKPILPLELELIQERLKDKNASVEFLKPQYHRDPIFCANLISLAWQATKNKSNHPIAADHAMSIIGIGGATQYFSKLKTRDATQLSDEVRFLLSSSLLAAELACLLSNNPHLYWAALFHQLPDIFLWHMHLQSMWQIHYRQVHLAKKMNLFEQAKLGFNLADWRLSVAVQFQMSEINLTTYQKPLPNKPDELLSYIHSGITKSSTRLKQWHKTDSWTILLANWLAKSMLHPAMPNSYCHYRALTQRALALNDKKMAKIIGQSLRNSSAYLIDSKLLIPAVSFLYQNSKPVYPKWLTSPEITTSQGMVFNKHQENKFVALPKEIMAKRVQGKPLIKPDSASHKSHLIQKLEQQPEKFESSVKMIGEVLNSIINDLHYDRVSLLSIERKRQFATTKIALARPKLKNIRPDFSFKPDASQRVSPLIKFTQQQGVLVFSKDKHAKIWPKLPLAIQKEKVENFFFYSLKQARQVKFLIYVDAKDHKRFSPEKITPLKILLSTLNKALLIRERNKSHKPINP